MDLNIDQLRAATPGIQNVLHFNNAGCSLAIKEVVDIITEYLQLEAMVGGYEAKELYQIPIDQFYQRAAQLINASPNEIALVGNASEGFNKALYAIPFQKGDIILTSEVEYGNNFINFLKLKKEKGIEVQIIPNDEFGNIMLDKMEEMISPQVKLVAITHIPTNSGLIVPVEKIGIITKKHNILYLVDACQSVGHIPVDVEKIQCDFLSTTSRKYLRGPRGLGFMYVRKGVLEKLNPPSLDMETAHWDDAQNYHLDYDIKMFENWEKSYALVLGFSKALSYLNELGVENTWKRIQSLANILREKLNAIDGVKVMDIGHQQCGIVSFIMDEIPPEDLQKVLLKQNVNISVSARFCTVIDMDKRGLKSVNRASIHYYNSEEEIDFFIEKIAYISDQISKIS